MANRNVLGFASRELLSEHFAKHNFWDFQLSSAAEYEAQAVAFLSAPLARGSGIEECLDDGGDVLRYNTRTNEFAVLALPSTVRTYFKPMRAVDAPPGFPISKTHSSNSNHAYFLRECHQ